MYKKGKLDLGYDYGLCMFWDDTNSNYVSTLNKKHNMLGSKFKNPYGALSVSLHSGVITNNWAQHMI